MIALPQRQELVADIEQACKNGVLLVRPVLNWA